MSDVHRTQSESKHGSPHAQDERIDRDLEALGARSLENLTPLTQTMNRLSGNAPKSVWEERIMAFSDLFKTRPRVAAFAGVAVVALALLLIPISYTKTVGHEVSMNLAGVGISQETVRNIAEEWKEALGVESVKVTSRMGDAAASYTLAADVGAPKGAAASIVNQTFAQTLVSRGYDASAETKPIREKVSGNVYAMIGDTVIRVEVEGKSAEEIEAEIEQQLAASNLPNAEVKVTKDDDKGLMEIRVTAEGECEPGDPVGEGHPQIVLTAGGEDSGSELNDAAVRIIKRESDGGEEMVVEYMRDGVTATATVANSEALSPGDLAAEVLNQLTAQGITGISVTAEDGCVQILDMDAAAGALGTETGDSKVKKSTSWGAVKKDAAGN